MSITMAQARKDNGWLGPVIKVHEVGPYSIVEYWHHPASNAKDKRIYRAFAIYIDDKSAHNSYSSLDEALAGCIAIRHDGINTGADRYFIRGIGADVEPEYSSEVA